MTCIYEDLSLPEGEGPVYWIATHGDGLKRLSLKDGKIISYTTANGMTTDFIYQFFEDQRGHFWLMSNSGILHIKKSELNSFVGDSTGKINCTSFLRADGMKISEFHNEFSKNSAFKARNGELWFLTIRGIAIVNPARVPPVVIEAIFFDGQTIPMHLAAAANTFKGNRDFSFQFTAPTFLSPEKIKFKFQLEGFEKEWVSLPAGSERVAEYQNLDPGTYTFRVMASNAEGVWNRTGDSITFTLKPFFYQTFIFKVVVFLLVVFLLVSAVYFYKKRPAKEKTNLEEPEKKEEKQEGEDKDMHQGTPMERGFVREREEKVKYKSSNLTPEFAREYEKKLKHLMEVEKIYRDENISLQSLAKKIPTKPYKLSQILNERMNRGFYDFINYYRIEEAKMILKSPGSETLKMPVVAGEVGFNTTAAFYKIFKKHTGMTPIQYKKEINKKKKSTA